MVFRCWRFNQTRDHLPHGLPVVSLCLSVSPLAKSMVGISVSSISVRIAVVSTIVSSVSTIVSVWVVVVATIVGSGSIGISLGLGSHDGEKGNGENGLELKTFMIFFDDMF